MKLVLVRVAPWSAIALAGAIAFGVVGFVSGVALLALAEALTFLRESQAMKHAAAQGLAIVSADAKAIHERMERIERDLKDALTPERMELAKKLVSAKMAGLLGR